MTTVLRTLAAGAVLFAAAASAPYAEEGATPKAAPAPPELTVAPTAPDRVPEAPADSRGKPANICQELVTFIEHRKESGPPPAVAQESTSQKSSDPKAQHPDEPQQKSGITAPIPTPKSAQRAPFVTVEQAQEYLKANDLPACQQAARTMRRAGVPMPDGLLALAALRAELLKAALEGK